MKRKFVLLLVLVMALVLSSCGTSGVMTHIKSKEAVKITKSLTGMKVSLVSEIDVSDKERVFLMADQDGNQFAIKSELKKDIVDDEEWGFDRCYVSDNYIRSVFEQKKPEIQRIIKKYELYDYLDESVKNELMTDFDITYADGTYGATITLYINNTDEEILDILKRASEAYAEIDAILKYSYHPQNFMEESYIFDSTSSARMVVTMMLETPNGKQYFSSYVDNSTNGLGDLEAYDIFLKFFEAINIE